MRMRIITKMVESMIASMVFLKTHSRPIGSLDTCNPKYKINAPPGPSGAVAVSLGGGAKPIFDSAIY
jgi:hypothetical protein